MENADDRHRQLVCIDREEDQKIENYVKGQEFCSPKGGEKSPGPQMARTPLAEVTSDMYLVWCVNVMVVSTLVHQVCPIYGSMFHIW